jgi:hypothetical protein
MKNIIEIVFGVAAAFVVAGSAVAGSAVYTDKPSFLSAFGVPLSVNTFGDLNYEGATGPLNYPNGGGPAYSIGSPPELGGFALNGAIGALDNGLDPFLQIDILAGGATGVGANFYGTDGAGIFGAATMLVSLSDGTTNSVSVQHLTDFLGFVTSGPRITSVQIHNPKFAIDGLYPSMDNLYVTAVVPEPSVILMNLAVLMSVGVGTVYYRRRNAQRG